MTTHATPPLLTIPVPTPELAARLQDGLARVDALLREVVDHEDPFVAAASAHLAQAGGKRFRPLLTFLAAEVGDGINEAVVRAAAGVELTHLASLYHDDVMDEARGAPRRSRRQCGLRQLDGDPRRRPALRQGLGARRRPRRRGRAHPGADLRAALLRADPGRPAVPPGRRTPSTTTSACSPTRPAPSPRPRAATARCSAATGQRSSRRWRAYGEKLGVAFQLADDLIDIASDSDASGKTPGTDLREGVDTLAVLRAKASTDPADARLLELLAPTSPMTTTASPRR